MPITVKWLNEEKTCLMYHYQGEWTLNDFHEGVRTGQSLSEEIEHPHVSISDFTHSKTAPRQILSARNNASRYINAYYRGSILIRPGLLISMLSRLLMKSMHDPKNQMQVANSLEEALMIAEQRLKTTEAY